MTREPTQMEPTQMELRVAHAITAMINAASPQEE